MPNGYAINNKLEFQESIRKKDDRELLEFTAELIYDHCEEQKNFDKRISNNTKMIWQNRYIIIGLILILITLGVIDANAVGLLF